MKGMLTPGKGAGGGRWVGGGEVPFSGFKYMKG